MGRHAGARPSLRWLALVAIVGLALGAALSALSLLNPLTPRPRVTITVPGPTVTVSYLIVKTAMVDEG